MAKILEIVRDEHTKQYEFQSGILGDAWHQITMKRTLSTTDLKMLHDYFGVQFREVPRHVIFM